jgi:hypothetical protein
MNSATDPFWQKSITPQLDDAPPMVIVPVVCHTVRDLCKLMAHYPPLKARAIAQAWAHVQRHLWGQNQNPGAN